MRRDSAGKAIYLGVGSSILLSFVLLLLASVFLALGIGSKIMPKVYSLTHFLLLYVAVM